MICKCLVNANLNTKICKYDKILINQINPLLSENDHFGENMTNFQPKVANSKHGPKILKA